LSRNYSYYAKKRPVVVRNQKHVQYFNSNIPLRTE